MEEFSLKTKIYAGAGAVAALEAFGAKRLLLVTDPYFMKNGTAQRIAALSKAEKIEYFDRVQPDPTVALAAEGTAKLRQFQPDLLVALGGGSAMDCAKAMAYFAQGEVPLAAIPTTSGSGSEVTDFAILTHGKAKHPLVDERLRPTAAILDSDLLKELPPALIADTGFDVLTHALEAYVATGAGAFSDMYARESFRIAYAVLPASYAGKREVRLRMHLASTMAGYYALALPLMAAQALLTDGFTALLKLRQGSLLHTLVYALVMTVLYFVSYSIQQRWVFASKKTTARGNEK